MTKCLSTDEVLNRLKENIREEALSENGDEIIRWDDLFERLYVYDANDDISRYRKEFTTNVNDNRKWQIRKSKYVNFIEAMIALQNGKYVYVHIWDKKAKEYIGIGFWQETELVSVHLAHPDIQFCDLTTNKWSIGEIE